MNKNFIPIMYKAVDSMDARAVADTMTENGAFRFANIPAVEGKENIIGFLEEFFKSIKAIKHSELEYWFTDNNWFVNGTVTYTRHDDSALSVPFSVILKMQEELIDQYLVFVDTSELYN